MATPSTPSTPYRQQVQRAARTGWWLLLLLGILWIAFGMVILSYEGLSLRLLAVFVGVAFLIGGVTQLGEAATAPSWRWLHAVVGVLSLAAGVAALVWPRATLVVVALLLSWYLVALGTFRIVAALMGPKVDWWWVALVLGIVELLVGFWAAGYPGRSLLVFATVVGVYALVRGVLEIVLAVGLRTVTRDLARPAT